MTREKKDVVIVGSGMAGLTAGAYLALAGHSVTIYEQSLEIGGVTATLRRDGFGWDLGPLLLKGFGPGERAYRILADLGVANQVKTVLEDRAYAFPDFDLWKPTVYGGPYWRRDRLKGLFPEESAGLDRYYAFYDQMMDLVALNNRADAASALRAIPLKLKMWRAFQAIKDKQNWSAQQLMDHFFQEPQLKAVFTSILADFVTRPSQFPALGIPVLNVENSFDKRMPLRQSKAGPRPGHHYILGGCGQLVEAVAGAIRRDGGQIHTNALVERVVIEGQRIKGVMLRGGHFKAADLVIATGGARETFFNLVGQEHLPDALSKQVSDLQRMESVLMVHLGVDFDPRPHQRGALCYYYGTYDIEGAVVRCQRGEYHEGRDGFLIYIPSMHSPQLAPTGTHAVTVYTIAPNHLCDGSWSERREEMADKLLIDAEKAIPGLRERSRTRVVFTPQDFRNQIHQEHHAFGGNAPVLGQESPGYRTPLQGLWFIGSQSKSGGGVPNVMTGARDAVREMTKA